MFSGRKTSTIQMRGCVLFYSDNVCRREMPAVSIFNWLYLKTCCVCVHVCVYSRLISGASLQWGLLILVLELKALYLAHTHICNN